jgi:hypothetical protein
VAEFFFLAAWAAVNPTLLAATTVMLVLPSPKRLLVGYLIGAYLTSISLGLVIVFSLQGTSSESTAKQTVSPALDIVFGLLLVAVAYALGSVRGHLLAEWRSERKAAKQAGKEKKDPLPQRLLGRGSARVAFVVGAALSLPSVSYLTALHRLDVEDPGRVATVLSVIGFNLIMMLLLEVPLLGYLFAPERTEAGVESFKDWLARRGRIVATYVAAILGGLLILRGVIEFLAHH